jgi:hypothetical protein
MQDQIFVEDSEATTGTHFQALFVHFANLDRKKWIEILEYIYGEPVL